MGDLGLSHLVRTTMIRVNAWLRSEGIASLPCKSQKASRGPVWVS